MKKGPLARAVDIVSRMMDKSFSANVTLTSDGSSISVIGVGPGVKASTSVESGGERFTVVVNADDLKSAVRATFGNEVAVSATGNGLAFEGEGSSVEIPLALSEPLAPLSVGNDAVELSEHDSDLLRSVASFASSDPARWQLLNVSVEQRSDGRTIARATDSYSLASLELSEELFDGGIPRQLISSSFGAISISKVGDNVIVRSSSDVTLVASAKIAERIPSFDVEAVIHDATWALTIDVESLSAAVNALAAMKAAEHGIIDASSSAVILEAGGTVDASWSMSGRMLRGEARIGLLPSTLNKMLRGLSGVSTEITFYGSAEPDGVQSKPYAFTCGPIIGVTAPLVPPRRAA